MDPLDASFDADELKRRSAHGTLVTAAAQVARILVHTVGQIICARLLFPSSYGLLAMAYPLIVFIAIFNDLGLAQAIVQRERLDHKRISSLFWVSLVVGVALGALIACAAPLAAMLYGEPRVVSVAVTLALFVPVSATGAVAGAVLMRQMRFTRLAANELIAITAGTALTVLLAWLGFDYWALIWGQAAFSVLSTGLNWWACRWRPSLPQLVPGWLSDLKFGGNLTASNLASYLSTAVTNAILGAVSGTTALGLYDRAERLVVQPLSQMLVPFQRVTVPLLSRLLKQAGSYRNAFFLFLRIGMMVTVPLMITCAIASRPIIELLLGPRWLEAAPVFGWICLRGIVSKLNNATLWLYVSQNKLRELRNFTLLTSAVSIACVAVAVPWGIVAVAAAVSAGTILIGTPLLVYGATRTGAVSSVQVARAVLPYALAGTLAATICTSVTITAGPVAQILITGLITYAIFLAVAIISPAQRQALRTALSYLRPASRAATAPLVSTPL